MGFRVVFMAGALPLHPHKELSFLDLVHFERYVFKKAKVFGVPFLKRLMCTRCAKWDAVPHPAKGLRFLQPFVFNAIVLKKATRESFGQAFAKARGFKRQSPLEI